MNEIESILQDLMADILFLCESDTDEQADSVDIGSLKELIYRTMIKIKEMEA